MTTKRMKKRLKYTRQVTQEIKHITFTEQTKK